MTASPVLWTLDERGLRPSRLNRPEVNNAYDGALIAGVLAAMDDLGKKPNSARRRAQGRYGSISSAGADLKWINGVRPHSAEANEVAAARDVRSRATAQHLADPHGRAGAGRPLRRRHRRDRGLRHRVIAADNALFSITEVRRAWTAAIAHPAALRRHRRCRPLREDR